MTTKITTTSKLTRTFLATALAGFLLSAVAGTTAQAQAVDSSATATSSGASSSDIDTPAPGQAPAGPTASKKVVTASPGNWHVDATAYLWFPGLHGNLNAFGYDLGFKASASDLLSHLRIGLMAATDVRYKELVLTSDVMWITLTGTNTKTLPLPSAPTLYSDLTSRVVIFTQKVGYRLIDSEKVKIDGFAGFRFWHLGTTLNVTPSPLGTGLYASKNWTDPLVGARIQVPLSEKMMATVAGDVGGWGAGSQQDYQIVGGLTYKLGPKLSASAAWRYLYLDYGQNAFTTQMAMSGPLLGVTYTFQKAN